MVGKIRDMKIKTSLLLLICIVGLQNLFAQESVVVSGGQATGSGSVSYSIGQLVTKTNEGTNGNRISEGLQQPYEISVVTYVEKMTDKSYYISAYPNPTKSLLILNVESNDFKGVTYQLFDTKGILIKSEELLLEETYINISELKPANYFLKVIDNNQLMKTFKIIKNK